MSDWFGRFFSGGRVHEIDSDTANGALAAASKLDLGDTDKVTVELVRWAGSEWTPWRHDGHLLEALWTNKWSGLYIHVRCPKAAGRQCMTEPDGCMLADELQHGGLEMFTDGLDIPDETNFTLPLALEYRVRDSHGEDDDEFLEIRPANWSS